MRIPVERGLIFGHTLPEFGLSSERSSTCLRTERQEAVTGVTGGLCADGGKGKKASPAAHG